MRLSVIVPFHRRIEQLSRCLEAITVAARQLESPCEILIAADGARDDASAVAAAHGARLLSLPGPPRGPGAARNSAAAAALGDTLVFVDSDVIANPDALRRIERLFQDSPEIDAVFGAYDDHPSDDGFVSQTKNLAHAFVHRQSSREAVTFWAGLGAVRAAAFRRVSGFDERFGRPSVEDIDLGYRLNAAGSRIALEPEIRGTHLKRWTAMESVKSDIFDRGIPWTQLVHRYSQLRSDLNLTHRYRACVALTGLALLSLLLVWLTPWMLALAGASLVGVAALDSPYLTFIAQRRGALFAAGAFPLRVVHHLVSGFSFAVGTATHLARRGLGISLPGVIADTAWPPTEPPRPARNLARWGGLAALLLGALMISRGLGDESVVLVGGDEVRYMMNGVFLRDAIADGPFWSISHALNYARHYYAQYPALSIGFHPPLLPIAEVPFLAVLGVSVTAARLTTATFFLSALVLLYALMSRGFGPLVGFLTAALLATNWRLLYYARHVLSEIPTLALVTAAAFFIDRFCRDERRSDLIAFVAVSAASVYAKQLAGLIFPAYFLYALVMLGFRRLLRPAPLIAALALGLMVAPAVPMTLAMSSSNVSWVKEGAGHVSSWASTLEPLVTALKGQFSLSVLVLAVIGLVGGALRRERETLLLVLWLGASMASVVFVTRGAEPIRYGIYMMPPLVGLAALAARAWPWRGVQTGMVALIAVVIGVQIVTAFQRPLSHAPGYEKAAQYVLDNPRGTTTLYSGEVDSGLFVFFTRKHDPDRHAIILRADKLLATNSLDRIIEDRIASREEIYERLREFGVGYVVIEDRATDSAVINWLREETQSKRFAERFRAPIGNFDPRLAGASMVVYEFLETKPAAPDAVVDMNVPLARSSVLVRLKDLVAGTYRR